MSLPTSPTVSKVVRGDLCTGCGLCAGVSGGALAMRMAAPGYARPEPQGPLDPAAERRIASACPGAVVAPWTATGERHPYWGPYLSVHTGAAVDQQTRFHGSSGGVVTALAAHALGAGIVDRVLHVVPDLADPAANDIVVSSSPSEVLAAAGSRYVSSSPLQDIERALADGGRMAFIGKPCDVSALRRLAQVDPRVQEHVPLMLAFFCAGVPSRRAVGRVLAAMGVQQDDLVSFRYRGDGWPGKATAVTRDGRRLQMSYEESWGGYLSKEVQFRCKICPDAVGGVADVACADAWYGGETGYPTFEEQEGRSLVMVRTEAGAALVRQAEARGDIQLEPLDVSQIDLMQPSQARRKRLVRGRKAALATALRPTPVMTGLMVEEASRRAGPLEQLRNYLGAVRRAVRRAR